MSTTRTLLFGGALFCAGIVATPEANAQQFTIGDSFSGFFGTTPGAYAYASFVGASYVYAFGPASGPADFDATTTAGMDTNTSAFVLSSTELTASATKPVGVIGGNSLVSQAGFTLDAPASVSISWAVDESTALVNRQFQILDADNGDAIVFDYLNEATPGAGSATLSLDAGTNYTFLINYNTFDANDGNALFSVVIPSPGALSLFAGAGLVATRRRR